MKYQLVLTPEQAAEIKPALDRANSPMSPDILLGQVLRADWRQGGHLYLQIALVPRRIAAAMRACFLKEAAKPATSARKGRKVARAQSISA